MPHPTPLLPGSACLPRDNVNSGPVHVVSTNGVGICISERSKFGQRFNEVMGYPGNQLTTDYWFTSYDDTGMITLYRHRQSPCRPHGRSGCVHWWCEEEQHALLHCARAAYLPRYAVRRWNRACCEHQWREHLHQRASQISEQIQRDSRPCR